MNEELNDFESRATNKNFSTERGAKNFDTIFAMNNVGPIHADKVSNMTENIALKVDTMINRKH